MASYHWSLGRRCITIDFKIFFLIRWRTVGRNVWWLFSHHHLHRAFHWRFPTSHCRIWCVTTAVHLCPRWYTHTYLVVLFVLIFVYVIIDPWFIFFRPFHFIPTFFVGLSLSRILYLLFDSFCTINHNQPLFSLSPLPTCPTPSSPVI